MRGRISANKAQRDGPGLFIDVGGQLALEARAAVDRGIPGHEGAYSGLDRAQWRRRGRVIKIDVAAQAAIEPRHALVDGEPISVLGGGKWVVAHVPHPMLETGSCQAGGHIWRARSPLLPLAGGVLGRIFTFLLRWALRQYANRGAGP